MPSKEIEITVYLKAPIPMTLRCVWFTLIAYLTQDMKYLVRGGWTVDVLPKRSF